MAGPREVQRRRRLRAIMRRQPDAANQTAGAGNGSAIQR